MPVFVVVAKRGEALLRGHLAELPEGSTLEFAPNVWFAEYDGTTRGFAERLNIRDNPAVSAVVLPTSNYSGRASGEVWEWLNLHASRGDV